MFQIISNDDCGVWFLLNGVVILFIDKNGVVHSKGDVIAFSNLPEIPPTHTLYHMETLDFMAMEAKK